MPNYAAKKTPGASSQLINDWKSPVDEGSGKPISLSMFYKRVGFIGSFRAGFQCLDQADAVLSTVWHTTVNNAGSTTDAAYVSYSAVNLDVVAGTYFIRFLIEVGVTSFTAHSAGDVYFDNTNLYEMEIPNLDLVRDGPSYGKVNNTNITAGNITSVYRDSGIRPVADFINKALDTVDDVPDGTLYAKVKVGNLSTGDITRVKKGAGYIGGDDIFEISVDTLDSVAEGSLFGRVKQSVLTNGEVAKLIDEGFRPDSEADGPLLNAIGTSFTDITPELNDRALTLIIDSSTTGPHFTTGVRYAATADKVLLRYHMQGSWPSQTYQAAVYGVTSSALVYATVYADNTVRTVTFDLAGAGFTAGEDIRLLPVTDNLPLGTSRNFDVYQFCVGQPGAGVDGITPLNGLLGVGTLVPVAPLDLASQDNGDLTTTEGDFRLGDGTQRLKMGIALTGSAGDAAIAAEGGTNTLRIGSGSTALKQGAITIVDGVTSIVLEDSIEATLTTGWDHYGDIFGGSWTWVRYYKDPCGIVHLEGLAYWSSGADANIFTLPSGYLPDGSQVFTAMTSLGAKRVDLGTGGSVASTGLTNGEWISLSGITFRAAP